MIRFLATVTVLLSVSALSTTWGAEDRKARVLNDRKEVQAAGHWIYNDFTQGVAEAVKTGKPMLVVLRCLP